MAKSKAGDDGSAMKKRKAPSNPDVGGAKSKKVAGASAKKRGGATAEQRWRPMPVRLDFGSAFCRHVFLRAPSKGADGAEEGTALFVAAVPPGWSKSTLREFMSRFGDVAGSARPSDRAETREPRRTETNARVMRRRLTDVFPDVDASRTVRVFAFFPRLFGDGFFNRGKNAPRAAALVRAFDTVDEQLADVADDLAGAVRGAARGSPLDPECGAVPLCAAAVHARLEATRAVAQLVLDALCSEDC